MASDKLKIRFQEIERLALAAGLKPFEVHFFEVPPPVIWQTAAYGLPTRYSHWSFGRVYQHQETQGEMGFAKIYELIINNNPSIAYLDKNNTDAVNLLIAAHCYGHSDFFANNIMFKKANETQMVDIAAQHAAIIDQFRTDYGDDAVDEWIDVALSLEQHIDVYKGRRRQRYPKRAINFEERKRLPWEDVVGNEEPLIKKVVKGIHIPPSPEKDILWFLAEYANLESWQKKIFEIVRRESYYFYPQFRTKIMNEGWASYWHAELMSQYALGSDNDYGVKDIEFPLTPEEHLDFASYHEKVVQPGIKVPLKIKDVDPSTGQTQKRWNPKILENPRLFGAATRLNPYYVGFRIFRDIKERWDEYFKQGYMENEWKEKVEVTIDGATKIRQVMEEEDDVSFMRNYLTEKLAAELHMFAYGSTEDYDDSYDIQEGIKKREKGDLNPKSPLDAQIVKNQTVAVRTKKIRDIVNTMAKSRNNYGVPCIVIRRIDDSGLMRLEHIPDDSVNIDINYAEHVLRYIYFAWRRPVEMIRKAEDKTWLLTYDGIQFEVNHEASDYPECIEDTDVPSSW